VHALFTHIICGAVPESPQVVDDKIKHAGEHNCDQIGDKIVKIDDQYFGENHLQQDTHPAGEGVLTELHQY
jgi:hypothetical protein